MAEILSTRGLLFTTSKERELAIIRLTLSAFFNARLIIFFQFRKFSSPFFFLFSFYYISDIVQCTMKMVNLFFYFTLITLKNRGTKNSVIIVSRRNVEFSSTKIINWWNKVKIKKMEIKNYAN